jgi:putative ABC transport system ATP-binding protein
VSSTDSHNAPAIRAERLGKTYRGPAGEDVTALEGVEMETPRGACLALAGPSGSGKSTLLALLGGVQRPTAGEVHVLGVALSGLADAARARVRRRIGFVFQQLALLPRLSVWENVTYGLVPLGVSRSQRRKLAGAALSLFGLGEFQRRRPEQLSGGQQQRVALARAWIGRPELLLLDEPTAHLDAAASAELADLLRAARDAGTTVVLATHDERLLAVATQVMRLDAGRIVEQGRGGGEHNRPNDGAGQGG